jgi:hypothetical protein
MDIIITIGVIVLQSVVGQILGFGIAFAFGVGNGWELVVIPIGNTLGVWGIGAIVAALRGTFATRPYGARLIGTAVGSAIGVVIILITPAIGYAQVVYPLVGALLGFYLSPRIRF